ncbi:unnamed protein product, partial [Owenia fusiformis]
KPLSNLLFGGCTAAVASKNKYRMSTSFWFFFILCCMLLFPPLGHFVLPYVTLPLPLVTLSQLLPLPNPKSLCPNLRHSASLPTPGHSVPIYVTLPLPRVTLS